MESRISGIETGADYVTISLRGVVNRQDVVTTFSRGSNGMSKQDLKRILDVALLAADRDLMVSVDERGIKALV